MAKCDCYNPEVGCVIAEILKFPDSVDWSEAYPEILERELRFEEKIRRFKLWQTKQKAETQ